MSSMTVVENTFTLTIFKALDDATRLKLLALTARGEFAVNELCNMLGMGFSRISRHLKILTDAKILARRREGNSIYYRRLEAETEFINAIFSQVESEYHSDEINELVDMTLKERQEKSQRFFDQIAPDWDKLKSDYINEDEIKSEILNLIGNFRANTAVDIGTGTGSMLPFLATFSDKQIGVDSSSAMLSVARGNLVGQELPNAELIQSDWHFLPIEKDSADFVLCNLALHHASSPLRVIKEVSRILKPGGIFVLVDFESHNDTFLVNKMEDLWFGFEPSKIKKWITSADMRAPQEARADSGKVPIRIYYCKH